MTEDIHIKTLLEQVSSSIKELQVVVTDLAVVKSKLSGIEEDVSSLYRSLFSTDGSDSLTNRVTRLEDNLRSASDQRLGERVSSLEKNSVTIIQCKESHTSITTRIWSFLIPIAVALVLAVTGVLFNNVYIKKNSESISADQTKVIRQILKEELSNLRDDNQNP